MVEIISVIMVEYQMTKNTKEINKSLQFGFTREANNL